MQTDQNGEPTTSTETGSTGTSQHRPVPSESKGEAAPEVLPPLTTTARGPMDQSVPDVATGSTPLTRKDD